MALENEQKMIVDKNEMKDIEKKSSLSTFDLMEKAGSILASAIEKRITKKDHILILCGHGNNGGDGFVLARKLNHFDYRVMLVDGEPKTVEAMTNLKKIDTSRIVQLSSLTRELKWATIVIDCVYGFGFHCPLSIETKNIFRRINEAHKTVYSVDINSGCECDSGRCDSDAIRSDITFALDCCKPFHMLYKEHQMFQEGILLSMGLPHPERSRFYEMSESKFFTLFPKKHVSAYKGQEGKSLLVGGCYGMAGAISLNILGAQTVGASYVHVALPEEIYPIVAQKFLTAVYHPFGYQTIREVIKPLIHSAKAICYGSGAVYLPRKEYCLDLLLQESKVPVVLDAEALHLLHQNSYILKFVKIPVILTPHIGEFADILNQPISVVKDHKMEYTQKFAKEYDVYIVLKGPNTIVASPYGDVYINQSGNQALAQAGSGDLLTGIITGLLTIHHDVFESICMGVWLHGYLADLGVQKFSTQSFQLERFPEIMDQLFQKHGF